MAKVHKEVEELQANETQLREQMQSTRDECEAQLTKASQLHSEQMEQMSNTLRGNQKDLMEMVVHLKVSSRSNAKWIGGHIFKGCTFSCSFHDQCYTDCGKCEMNIE